MINPALPKCIPVLLQDGMEVFTDAVRALSKRDVSWLPSVFSARVGGGYTCRTFKNLDC